MKTILFVADEAPDSVHDQPVFTIGDMVDFYRYLFHQNELIRRIQRSVAYDSNLNPELQRAVKEFQTRSPSLRLRFGRSSPALTKYTVSEQNIFFFWFQWFFSTLQFYSYFFTAIAVVTSPIRSSRSVHGELFD